MRILEWAVSRTAIGLSWLRLVWGGRELFSCSTGTWIVPCTPSDLRPGPELFQRTYFASRRTARLAQGEVATSTEVMDFYLFSGLWSADSAALEVIGWSYRSSLRLSWPWQSPLCQTLHQICWLAWRKWTLVASFIPTAAAWVWNDSHLWRISRSGMAAQ